MVFESVVVDLLNRFLGDYVENLNSNQLRVGIWGGDVVLENLSLKPNVLEELNLPLKIASGNLGKLCLKIPWQNLYSAPVIVSVERLFLILVPSQEVSYDATREEKWAQDAKKAAIQKFEESKKRQAEKDLPKPDDTFVEKLAVNIIKNVQVKIVDIHIRYEDRLTTLGQAFGFGITLHNLSIQSTNSKWEEKFVDQPSDQFFKVLKLEGLAVYWNCNSRLIWSKTAAFDAIQASCKRGIYTLDHTPRGYHYILGPINSNLKLLMNPKPELSKFSQPKVTVFWELESLSIGISKSQYQDLINLMESMDRMSRASPYRKYRPNLSVYRGHYKAWWRFAFTCILEEDVRRVRQNWSWEKIIKHRARCQKYSISYRKKITTKKPSDEVFRTCSDLEKYMDVLNIILVRQRVEMEVATTEQAIALKKTEASWFSGWFGGRGSSKQDSDSLSAAAIAKKFESAMTAEEKEKLYKAIDYEENVSKAMYPETYVELSVSFNLPSLNIEIRDDVYDNPRVLFAELKSVGLDFGKRPAVSGITLSVTITQLTVFGMEQGNFLPKLVISKGLEPKGAHLLTLLFEISPNDKLCDQRIHLFSRPLEIVFDGGTISKVTDVFKPQQQSVAISQLQAAANLKLKNIKEMSALGLQYAIDNHVSLDLNVDLQSSYILIPYKGMYRRKEDLIVINLGHISMKSIMRDPVTPNVAELHKAGTSEDDIMRRMIAQSYDQFIIRVEDMQILMASVNEDWKSTLALVGRNTQLHVLTPTSVVVQFNRCLISDDLRMPKVKIAVNLPSVSLLLADERLLHLLAVLTSLNVVIEEETDSLVTDAGSHKSSVSLATKVDLPDMSKRRDMKPWLKLKTAEMKKNNTELVAAQIINLDMTFELPNFCVSLHRIRKQKQGVADLDTTNRMLLFRMTKTEVRLIQSNMHMEVSLRLGGVTFDAPDSSGDVRLLDTPMSSGVEEYLFSIIYKKLSRMSHISHVLHDEQFVEVTFTKLNVHLHQEALVALIVYIQALAQQMDATMNPPSTLMKASLLHHNLPIVEEGEILSAASKPVSKLAAKKHKKKLDVMEVYFQFKASMETFNVTILNRRKTISYICIQGCSVEMTFRYVQLEITAKLKNFTVTDLNPFTNHSKIVSIVGNDMMLAKVVMYNNELIPDSNIQSSDISISANMACIRFVYVNAFVSSLLKFLSSFQATKEKMMDKAVEAAYIAKQNIQEAKTSRIALAVNFQAPLIVLPINLRSASALILDFGKLSVNNRIEIIPGGQVDNRIPIVDEMTVGLENVKISRVKLGHDYIVKNECPLLQPVTFNIGITRNLSTPWYTDIADVHVQGRLEDFHMTLTEEDLKMVMRVLTENIGSVEETESSETLSLPVTQPVQAALKSKKSADLHLKERAFQTSGTKVEVERHHRMESHPVSESPPAVPKGRVQEETIGLRIDFTMDNCILDLFNGGIIKLDDEAMRNEAKSKNSLGRFSVHNLCSQCSITASGAMFGSFCLSNCLLEDTRRTHCGHLTRLMQRKDTTTNTSTSNAYFKNMVQIDFNQHKEETILDIRVYSFELILSLEYLMRLSTFVNNSFGSGSELRRSDSYNSLPSIKPSHTKTRSSNLNRKVTSVKQVPMKKHDTEKRAMLTINLFLEKPDIILVESIADIDTNCLVLNCELATKLRLFGDQQVIITNLQHLQLFSCCYNPLMRNSTKALILHPCRIDVAGSTPEGAGLHMDVTLSEIRLGVSPGTIEILNRVYQAVHGSVLPVDSQEGRLVDYSDLWAPQEFKEEDFWFIKTEFGQDAMEMAMMTDQSEVEEEEVKEFKKEVCIITVPLIALTIEAGVGKQTLPMVKIDMSVNAVARNWSAELEVENTVCLKMSYYNSRLALWEPIIEPVENVDSQERPWSMKLSVMTNKPLSDPSPETDSTGDELITPPPKMAVMIVSDDVIELTVTKTSIVVFSQLAEAFQNAVTAEGWSQKTALKAPFVVKNDSGIPIMIQLQDSPFQPQNLAEGEDYAQVLLHTGSELLLALKEKLEEVEEAPWNAITQGRKDSDDQSQQLKVKEMFLNIQMVDSTTWLRLAVVRAEKRYFDLQHRAEDNEPWGLVSHVKVIAGSSLITLRGILQITNHFHVAVNVYYMTPRGNELECVGTIEPDSELNLPLASIYTLTGELFFSIIRYTVSVKPFVWKALKNEVVTTELLQCMPKSGSADTAPFFLKVVGEMEQVYYEHTMRHTMQSTLYNIHLRPAVVLKNLLPVDIGVKLDKCPATRRVNAGEGIQLPTAEPGVTRLILEIGHYLDKDWVCSQPIQWNAPPFTTCTFSSRDSFSKMNLDLGIHTEFKNGTTTMSIYCPFWMINKTGLSLAYRSEEGANILSHPADHSGPILFSFKAKSFFGKKKAAVRVGDGEWSDKFSLDVAGSSGIIRCKTRGVDRQLGVSIQLTHFTLTKEVTFTPFYVLINNSKLTIQVQEADRPADPWTEVASESCTPMWPVNDKDKELRLRIAGTHEVSAPFSYAAPHTILLQLANSYGGVNVDVQITDSAIYLSMSLYAPGLAPALLMNHTTRPIKFREKGKEKETAKERKKELVSVLEPGHMARITWVHSLGSRLLTWNIDFEEVTFDMRQDGLGEFKQSSSGTDSYWVSFLNGIQRTLIFTEDPTIASRAHSSANLEAPDREISLSFAGLGLSLVNNYSLTEVLYISIASSGIAWETRKNIRKQYKPLPQQESMLIEIAYQKYTSVMLISDHLSIPANHIVELSSNLAIDFLTMNMLRPTCQQIRRTHYVGLWIQQQTSPHQFQMHAKINRIQVDCQIVDNVFPVVLAPVPPPKSVAFKSVVKPFAEVSIVRRINEHSSLQQYKYFKFLIQEFHIKLDIGLVNALVDLLEPKETTEAEEAALFLKGRALIDEPLMAHVSLKVYQEQKNFYDFLHFSPLKIHLSFSLVSGGLKGKQEMPAFLNVLMQSLGVTLTDVQDVIFKLGYFEREHTFLTQHQLISAASSHYISQAVKQLYVLVLGLDVLGNPYGLVLGLTQGVEDLFYEPFQGAIQGPGEFAEGLVLGMRSLLGHTVGGAAGAASRITGAMGKGLAALTFDKDYQRKRREAMNQRHTNVQSGLAQSSKGLVMGVVDGVSGVFTKPISGAREDGVAGFFTGMGKGVMGLVTRPTAGVIDFASGSLDAVKRATELNEEVLRRRLPRFFHVDGLIRPYSKIDARGNQILHDLEKGRYVPTDVYVCHLDINKDTLLLTDQRLMFISHGDMFGSSLTWSYTWESLKVMPHLTEIGIYIAPPPEERTRVLGIFGSSEVEPKLITIKDKQSRDWMFVKIMSHLPREK